MKQEGLIKGTKIKPWEYVRPTKERTVTVPPRSSAIDVRLFVGSLMVGVASAFHIEFARRDFIDITPLDSVGGFREVIAGPMRIARILAEVQWITGASGNSYFSTQQTLTFVIRNVDNTIIEGDGIITKCRLTNTSEEATTEEIVLTTTGQLTISADEE